MTTVKGLQINQRAASAGILGIPWNGLLTGFYLLWRTENLAQQLFAVIPPQLGDALDPHALTLSDIVLPAG